LTLSVKKEGNIEWSMRLKSSFKKNREEKFQTCGPIKNADVYGMNDFIEKTRVNKRPTREG
jgi:hypothetical protein